MLEYQCPKCKASVQVRRLSSGQCIAPCRCNLAIIFGADAKPLNSLPLNWDIWDAFDRQRTMRLKVKKTSPQLPYWAAPIALSRLENAGMKFVRFEVYVGALNLYYQYESYTLHVRIWPLAKGSKSRKRNGASNFFGWEYAAAIIQASSDQGEQAQKIVRSIKTTRTMGVEPNITPLVLEWTDFIKSTYKNQPARRTPSALPPKK